MFRAAMSCSRSRLSLNQSCYNDGHVSCSISYVYRLIKFGNSDKCV